MAVATPAQAWAAASFRLGPLDTELLTTTGAELEALVSPPVAVSPVDTGRGLLYRVRIGPMESNEEILLVQQRLQASGYTGTQLLP